MAEEDAVTEYEDDEEEDEEDERPATDDVDPLAELAGAPDGERKVVLLTGAAGTFGSAFCRRLAPRYDIVAVWHNRRPSYVTDRQTFVDPLHPDDPPDIEGTPPVEVRADLTKDGDIERVVELALAHYGRIDVLVNAAGTRGGGRLLAHAAINQAPKVFGLNAFIPVRLVAAVTEHYWREEEYDNAEYNRCVVNVSAAASVEVVGGRGESLFGSSKAALNMLSGHLADELSAYGVRVNALAPAPFPRVITPARAVAGAVRLIEGDETGRVLVQWGDGDELI